MEIVKLKKPTIKPPEMVCDTPLHPKLNEYELTSYLNQHSTNLLLGRPRSGKSETFEKGLSQYFPFSTIAQQSVDEKEPF